MGVSEAARALPHLVQEAASYTRAVEAAQERFDRAVGIVQAPLSDLATVYAWPVPTSRDLPTVGFAVR